MFKNLMVEINAFDINEETDEKYSLNNAHFS